MIAVSVVDDDRMLLEGMSAWFAQLDDLVLPTLAAAVRDVAEGGTAHSPELAFAWSWDRAEDRPGPSTQERAVLLAYASGMTLAAAARNAGVRPATAKKYLDRVMEKYARAGRPAYTKLELADRVREDGLKYR